MSIFNKKIFSVLFFTIFSAVTGVGIVVPLLPVYAHDLGASGLYISLIFGSFSISRTFMMPYFGRLSDKNGRKPYIAAGLLSYFVVSIALMFSTSVNSLIGIRFIQGIASAMIMPVTQAYVGDITPEGKEGMVMGLFNLSVFFSLSIGPLLGGFINDQFSLPAAFGFMGLFSLIGFFLCLFLLPPTKTERVLSKGTKPVAWRTLLKSRAIAALFSFRFVYTTCIGIIWCFMPIFADNEFALSSSTIGILVMLPVFINGVVNAPMGYLADRVNKKSMVVIGGLITIYAMVSFEWANGFWDLMTASTLFGIGGGIAMPPVNALAVVKGNKTGAMGSVMALMTMGHSMGMMIGSLFAGLTMDYFQLRHAFPCGALIMMLGLGLFLFLTSTRSASTGDG
jgi:DHA1 family multidrug resistance protein-like MFS transporter